MTAEEFSEVDHDLLADYLGGALEGTPEQDEVARLIAQDPSWAQAYALLAPAVAEVRADLLGWGEPTLTMPVDVADRILAALDAAELPAGPDSPAPDLPGTEVDHAGGGLPPLVPAQPLGGRRPEGAPRPGRDRTATRPGRRSRRWARIAGPVALAAAAVVGLGALQLARPDSGGDTTADTALNEPVTSPYVHEGQEGPEQAAAGAEPHRAPVTQGTPQRYTARDYTPQELTQEPEARISAFAGTAAPDAGDERMAGPADLARLDDQSALAACLADIGTEHGARPLVFEDIEYARFQGLPALVVRFVDASGARWAWVSGPECGIAGSGSDSRYRTRVG
ncbi:hypothetical protein ACGFIK_10620 [Micromonospora sp. NPDC048871]|uniref:hypothetical protein n=1 Tax=unclassified Micromonospora TaxID=2617518 RepID=UPI0033FDB6CC